MTALSGTLLDLYNSSPNIAWGTAGLDEQGAHATTEAGLAINHLKDLSGQDIGYTNRMADMNIGQSRERANFDTGYLKREAGVQTGRLNRNYSAYDLPALQSAFGARGTYHSGMRAQGQSRLGEQLQDNLSDVKRQTDFQVGGINMGVQQGTAMTNAERDYKVGRLGTERDWQVGLTGRNLGYTLSDLAQMKIGLLTGATF